ncbi:MAG: phosphoribosylamine--glycine ligase [Candidatus Symbiobacter sp.]|nr:phosphoribosylamine--glycine ligase [Candidatus Symbiobacter sp.]
MSDKKLNILVVGGGGREFSLAWKIHQSPLVNKVFNWPKEKPLMSQGFGLGQEDVFDYCVKEKIDLVVVGTETLLADGLVDQLVQRGIAAFGPNQAAAILEGSKGFMKDFCARHDIPTAQYRRFTDREQAHKFIQNQYIINPLANWVIKTDGLAAGKGVTVCNIHKNCNDNLVMAHAAIDTAMNDKKFGAAGLEIIIEECLIGREISFFALCDGKTAIPFGAAKDYKRAYDGDLGPNTGGMGAVSAPDLLTAAQERDIMENIIFPTMRGMAAEGREFKGILFAGLMLTPQGIKLLEFNVRFGDPECQALMMRLKSDLVPLMLESARGELAGHQVQFSHDPSICVVLAQKPYPEPIINWGEVRGLEKIELTNDCQVFYAAIANDEKNNFPHPKKYIAYGGRVLSVTTKAPTLAAAQKMAYEELQKIDFPNGFYRRDIGNDVLKKV